MLKNSTPPFRENTPRAQSTPACGAHDVLAAMASKIQHFFDAHSSSPSSLTEEMTFIRLELPVHGIVPMQWLSQQNQASRIYWCGREQSKTFGIEIAGAGIADTLSASDVFSHDDVFREISTRLANSPENLRYYGGFRFYDGHEVDRSWSKFGSYRFVVPRWEIQRSGKDFRFSCNFKLESQTKLDVLREELLSELQTLHFSPQKMHPVLPRPAQRIDLPDQDGWRNMINQALTALHGGELDKIVLARKTRFVFPENLEPLSLLSLLKNSTPNLFYFYFQPEPNIAFLGGSPERLYSRENRMLKSEAIAGTRARGMTPQEDHALANELLHCDKDLREHRFVVENIKENLEKLCHTVDIDDEITILKLSKIQHLRCRLQGILADDVSDAEIFKILHPTPAVGGSPTDQAIDAIKKLEPFDRGWYAAPLGWISQDAAEFVVGIRSGLVDHETLALFSGAGIVNGSTPDGEWTEIENKIGNFMKAIMQK